MPHYTCPKCSTRFSVDESEPQLAEKEVRIRSQITGNESQAGWGFSDGVISACYEQDRYPFENKKVDFVKKHGRYWYLYTDHDFNMIYFIDQDEKDHNILYMYKSMIANVQVNKRELEGRYVGDNPAKVYRGFDLIKTIMVI